jgi:ribonuclease-3
VEDLSELEKVIGHTFGRRELLVRALTHSSHSHERAPGGGLSEVWHNEQMEFLGDAVLGLLVSRELVERFPSYSEGQLSKMKAHLVSATHLFSIASDLQLGDFLQLGRGEEKSGGRHKRALLVDALEALIAAIYLDAGLDTARDVVERLVLRGRLDSGIEAFPFTDFKSALQEYLQANRRSQPRYGVLEERGPEHRKTFLVEVRVGKEFAAQAEGPTKKAAEQEAARLVLLHFRELDGQAAEAAGREAAVPQGQAGGATPGAPPAQPSEAPTETKNGTQRNANKRR